MEMEIYRILYFPLIGHNQEEINYAGYHYFQDGVYIKSFENFKDI